MAGNADSKKAWHRHLRYAQQRVVRNAIYGFSQTTPKFIFGSTIYSGIDALLLLYVDLFLLKLNSLARIICLRLGELPKQFVGVSYPARPTFGDKVHLLYLDDSGSTKNKDDRHVILAGVAVFERRPFWFSQKLDEIAAEVAPEAPHALEFRGGDIITGRKQWRKIPQETRIGIYERALDILGNSSEARLFGAVIHKAALSPDDPIEYAFEQLCNRFDRFLGRLHLRNDTQRGLLVLDESSYETTLQNLARNFRTIGHRWGQLYNMAEVPLFVDSKATRMIQLADLVAHSLRHYYERGNARYFDRIAKKFDVEGGVCHGLMHFVPKDSGCNCFCCRQRRAY